MADGLYPDGEVVSSDVAAFEEAMGAARWREAVGLYKGPFLDGFHLEGAAEFERWLERERRRLSMRHRQALEELAEEAEGAEMWSEAVVWWRQRLAQDPTNTPVVLRLMKALAADGHVAGAVKQARIHERRLRYGLDLPLPQEVRALVDELTQEAKRKPVEAPEPSTAPSEPSVVLEDEGTGRQVSAEGGRAHDKILDERKIPADSGTAARHPGARSPPSPTNPAPEKRGRRRRWVVAGGVLAAITVLAAGWFFGIGDGGEAGDRAAPGPHDASPVIVVLPFENLGSSDDAHVTDGITEELTVRLTAAPGLSVIARSTALRYAGASADIREVGRELGADYALEGTVRWDALPDADGRVRITAQLLRAADGTLLWAESYDRELAEIFEVQREIADEVTAALDLTFLEPGEGDLVPEPTGDLEAYDHYLQGQSYVARQFSDDAARAAIDQYERAVDLDPGFAADSRWRPPSATFWWDLSSARRPLEPSFEPASTKRPSACSRGPGPPPTCRPTPSAATRNGSSCGSIRGSSGCWRHGLGADRHPGGVAP